MKVNLYLPRKSQYFLNISVYIAASLCNEYWATYGDGEVKIFSVTTLKRVTQFRLAGRDQFYTIEQLVELLPHFYDFNIVDAQP